MICGTEVDGYSIRTDSRWLVLGPVLVSLEPMRVAAKPAILPRVKDVLVCCLDRCKLK